MIIPYSTDAPIYYFPWMTIGLIVMNAITFGITLMGLNSEGWLLTYGHGLHPLEWVAYNFLHFGPLHLIGNMFFLWAFGIVVEGKLGWWKFLILYLSVGICGGLLIQTAMLGYRADDVVQTEPSPAANEWRWKDNSVFAQENHFPGFDHDMDDEHVDAPAGENLFQKDGVAGVGNPVDVDPNLAGAGDANAARIQHAGAGGASLIIYGLMAIVLVWAPRNEIHCLWIGLRSGAFEIEYLYFCGFYIVTEVLSAVFSARGFEVSSEIGHATGAVIGFGLGTLFVKQNWVDCERWDLYSVIAGKHSASAHVGDWQNNYLVHSSRERGERRGVDDTSFDNSLPAERQKKKKKAKPKLMELDSFDEPFAVVDEEPEKKPRTPSPIKAKSKLIERPSPTTLPPIPALRHRASDNSGSQIRELISDGDFESAVQALRQHQTEEPEFELEENDLKSLADGLFKNRQATDAAPLLEEYIRRFKGNADRQRIKLCVLYIKFLQRPTAALKILVKLDPSNLPDDYRAIHQKSAKEAQKMISEGIVDSE